MISFENTKIAFADKTDVQLRKALVLFSLVKNPFIVKLGSHFLTVANRLRLPLRWVLKSNVFNHFCGGETLDECVGTMDKLADSNIRTILDYSAEGLENEVSFDTTRDRIIAGIEMSKNHSDIAFAVFKFTGIARFALLEKVNNGSVLSKVEQDEYERIFQRADSICRISVEHNLPVMIDAEETWIQDAIDEIAEKLMLRYNKNAPFVYNTLQMYRTDKLFYLKKLHKKITDKRYFAAFKLVRGAYMEKERDRAEEYGYASPVHPNKEATDRAFNDAVNFCLENIHNTAVCIGTHNDESCMEAIYLMDKDEIAKDHPWVYFSQLMGMSDHISYNLAQEGYNVSKYVPYGPLRMVMPYLIRRAEENTSVTGQTGRELYLIRKELKRRKAERADK
jgi:proline dehydrogenase